MHKYVVRSDTNLTRVDSLAKGHFTAAKIYVCCIIDDRWTFSTEFENARSEILCCFLSNDAANSSWTSEANQVKWKFVYLFGDAYAAFDRHDEILVKVLIGELFNDCTGVNGNFWRLHNDAISRRNSLHERLQSCHEWRVPRANHCNDAKRLIQGVTLARGVQKLSFFLVVGHPVLNVIMLVLETGFEQHYFHKIVDEHVSTQVGLHGLAKLLFHFFKARVELLQLFLSPSKRFWPVSSERLLELVCTDKKLIRICFS